MYFVGAMNWDGRNKSMIKIKVSYERPEELRKVLERLNPYVKSWKASRDQKGHFLKAYIIME